MICFNNLALNMKHTGKQLQHLFLPCGDPNQLRIRLHNGNCLFECYIKKFCKFFDMVRVAIDGWLSREGTLNIVEIILHKIIS